jgi:hypothetical protein
VFRFNVVFNRFVIRFNVKYLNSSDFTYLQVMMRGEELFGWNSSLCENPAIKPLFRLIFLVDVSKIPIFLTDYAIIYV